MVVVVVVIMLVAVVVIISSSGISSGSSSSNNHKSNSSIHNNSNNSSITLEKHKVRPEHNPMLESFVEWGKGEIVLLNESQDCLTLSKKY